MNFFRLRDFDFSNKRVLVRVDYNVPLDSKGRIVDTERIQLSLPTLNCILKQRPQQLVLITHWGRPQGKVVTSLKTDKLARTLEKSLKRKVAKLNNFQHSLPTTQIIMLENLRFWKGEEANSARFAQALANYGDIFVNEAFSTCHDAHASVVGIPQYLPSCAGLFLEKELHTITSTFSRPRRPFIAIIGGAKMNSKIKLLKNVLTKVDLLLLGGTMAFPFLVAQRKLASKYADAESIKVARWLLNNRTCARKLILAEDFVAMKDIGKKTIARFTKVLENAKTVAWNGPLGVVEDAHYRRGTREIARAIVASKAFSLVGGGDTAHALHLMKLAAKMSHVSTGGGASLVLFEGGTLPGIIALEKSYRKFRNDVFGMRKHTRRKKSST